MISIGSEHTLRLQNCSVTLSRKRNRVGSPTSYRSLEMVRSRLSSDTDRGPQDGRPSLPFRHCSLSQTTILEKETPRNRLPQWGRTRPCQAVSPPRPGHAVLDGPCPPRCRDVRPTRGPIAGPGRDGGGLPPRASKSRHRSCGGRWLRPRS